MSQVLDQLCNNASFNLLQVESSLVRSGLIYISL